MKKSTRKCVNFCFVVGVGFPARMMLELQYVVVTASQNWKISPYSRLIVKQNWPVLRRLDLCELDSKFL